MESISDRKRRTGLTNPRFIGAVERIHRLFYRDCASEGSKRRDITGDPSRSREKSLKPITWSTLQPRCPDSWISIEHPDFRVNKEVVSAAQQLAPSRTATLDMDNNLIIFRKRNTEIGYKKKPTCQPFNVYWDEQVLMLYSEFRDGNVPPGKEQLRLLREAEVPLPDDVEELRIRSDSAGYQHEFLEYMESGRSRFSRIGFAVGCDIGKSFCREVQQVDEKDWRKVEYLDERGEMFRTEQEVAEVCFIPETKNRKKTPPYFAIWPRGRRLTFNASLGTTDRSTS